MPIRKVNESIDRDAQTHLFEQYRAAVRETGETSKRSIHWRNKIALANRALVYRPAATYASKTGESAEDLENVGFIGLTRAVELFELDRGNRFSSYAMGFVRGEILHHLRDNGIDIRPKVRRREKDLYFQVLRKHKELLKANPNAPIELIALNFRDKKGGLIFDEHQWRQLREAMESGPIFELNESLIGANPEIAMSCLSAINGDLSSITLKCLIEVVLKQSADVPLADRVSVAAAVLGLSVVEVDQRTKIGLEHVAKVYEQTLAGALA
jgi:RNA polymerase sigma-B factor